MDRGDEDRAPARPITVLVLTPRMGGTYFGDLLAGVARELAGVSGRLVLVQTPEPDPASDAEGATADFAAPIAWDRIDGAVAILNTVGVGYLQRLRDAGKPVVLVSTRIDGFDAPLALPDNAGGTLTATAHLISHGHTRIGFVGNLAQTDIRERHAAYQLGLRSHGIDPDPALTLVIPDNEEAGGIRAARQLLDLFDPVHALDPVAVAARPTAVMVATDRNALGLIRTLAAAGVRVPADLAVIGFDNIEAGAFSTPTLSSVDQRFDEVGALAGRLVLAQIRGEPVPCEPHVLPVAPVVLRGSCGCDVPPAASTARLVEATASAICGALLTGDTTIDDPLREAVSVTVGRAEELLAPGAVVTGAQLRSLTESLRELTPRLDVLRRITAALIDHVERRAARAARADRVAAALWRLQASTLVEDRYVVDTGSAGAGRSDPRHLDWLAGTAVRAGVLALWDGDPAAGVLRVAGAYDPEGLLPGVVGISTTVTGFPPAALVDASRPVERGAATVLPVRTSDRDWGLLAVLSEIDTSARTETYQRWVSLLCTVFEQQTLQEEVRRSAERYALMTRATNDGLWEWDARTGALYLSDRCATLIGTDPDQPTDGLALWQSVIHPDDRVAMRRAIEAATVDGATAVSCEYRVRTADGTYRWVLSRAVGVADPTGTGTAVRIVGSLSDIDDRRCLEDRLRVNALHDTVTGLPNRRLFLDRLQQAVTGWQRGATPYAVFFLDLDGFKVVNDSLGHETGDRVLCAVGARIREHLRTVDTVARFGGDEFAILLHDTQPGDVLEAALRTQAALADVLQIDGHEFSIRASIGIATSALGYVAADDVLRDADAAMYHAKETEKGSLCFFDAAMHSRAVSQLRLHTELRRALEESRFEVHYQPIVDLASGRADRFEALVRWRHPERGLLLPDEFLPAMADAGLIVGLGRWIVEEVCRQLAEWGPRVANVSVNLSDREFWHSGLLAHVLGSLRRHGLTADRLTLEITENVIMRRPEVALRLMQEMHDAGLALHLDDFGTGYSSLETLHRFPVDAFKIDRSFIRGLAVGDRSAELVRAIVALGRALDLPVVAEGIETAEQLAFLREVGCATGQGFLFMPAVPGTSAPGLVGDRLGSAGSAGSAVAVSAA